MLDAVEEVAQSWHVEDGARIAGVHWYGPYFAKDKIGAHPKGYERNPDPAEYKPALARGIIKTATCAAEIPGAVEFCRAAKAVGCLVTCGHSNASWPEMVAVYEAGMRHVDHFWNAMSSTDSICCSTICASQSRMCCSVIAPTGTCAKWGRMRLRPWVVRSSSEPSVR